VGEQSQFPRPLGSLLPAVLLTLQFLNVRRFPPLGALIEDINRLIELMRTFDGKKNGRMVLP
jgi:hypothetical protein